MTGAFSNKRVLITGASGFVGSHLVRRMVEENAQVNIFVREGSDLWRIESLLKDINIHRADFKGH